MQRLVGVAFTAFVVLLAVTAVGTAIGEFDVVVDLTLALVGLAFLVGSVLALAAVGQRIHQLARFVLADVRDGDDVTTLAPGTHWLRLEAPVAARDETTRGVLDDDPTVALTSSHG
jgi:hypothetical protein